MALSLGVRSCVAGLFLAALGTSSGAGAQPTPVGPEFQVNSYTTNNQNGSSVAADADGDFVVVWYSYGSSGSDTSYYSIQGQRYDSTGSPVGSQFQVNTYTTNMQLTPSVAADADGDVVVVWENYASLLGPASIQGQRYDSAGSAVGSEFLVSSTLGMNPQSHLRPSVAADADGDVVAVWTGGDNILGRRYDSAGSAVGSQFQVNTYTSNSQDYPSVAADADGDFVVVWQSYGSSGGDTLAASIQGQRYSSAGSAVGSQFQVNTYTTNQQKRPSAAADADGDFVVVWTSLGSSGGDTSSYSLQGQRYDSAGSAAGSEFQVNTYTTHNQDSSSVAVDADGDFVVVWLSYGSPGGDTSSFSIQGRRYDSAGSPVGSEFQVNSYTTSFQELPSVSGDAGGDFVVVWTSDGSSGSDTGSWSIQGQRFTTAAKVPSLGPAALAGAALLMGLAVAIALRRRA